MADDPAEMEIPNPVYAPVLSDLVRLSVQPVLIGGAAVVLLGGRRVTPDLDLSISARELDDILSILYRNDFQVVAGWTYDASGAERVATTFSSPDSAKRAILRDNRRAFRTVHAKTGFMLDIWLELHIPHHELLSAGMDMKIGGHTIRVASATHLIELKKKAIMDTTDDEKRKKHEDDIRTLDKIASRRTTIDQHGKEKLL